MAYNLKALLHIGGILLTMALLVWCALNTQFYATILTLGLILVLQISTLLRHVQTTNRELTRFLAAIRYADFSQSFRGQPGHPSFQELGTAFDEVLEKFRRERSDKEAQAVYLEAFVQQLPIAVFALSEDGRIRVANQAFQHFLDGHHCRQIAQLRHINPALAQCLSTLEPGRDQMLRLQGPQGPQHLKLSCTLLRLRGRQEKLISLQDISGDLESQQLDAWQNLIRVMTHEIMNSITPITSLADTTHHYLGEVSTRLSAEAAADPEVRELLADAANASRTIGQRGQGLLRFVQSYRTLSRLPTPRPRVFRVRDLLQEVQRLMQEQSTHGNCQITLRCQPQTLELRADPDLLEQALINLVKNALEAMSEPTQQQLSLSAELRERGQIVLCVRDNGCGIEADNLDNIFVPFFTTKRGGTGIGMTLVKQIVTHNGGTLRVDSTPGSGTAVTLSFPAR